MGGVCKQSRWRHSVTEPSQDGGCVTMATLWQQQDGGYALLWKRFLHLQQYSHRLNCFLSIPLGLTIRGSICIKEEIFLFSEASTPVGSLVQPAPAWARASGALPWDKVAWMYIEYIGTLSCTPFTLRRSSVSQGHGLENNKGIYINRMWVYEQHWTDWELDQTISFHYSGVALSNNRTAGKFLDEYIVRLPKIALKWMPKQREHEEDRRKYGVWLCWTRQWVLREYVCVSG